MPISYLRVLLLSLPLSIYSSFSYMVILQLNLRYYRLFIFATLKQHTFDSLLLFHSLANLLQLVAARFWFFSTFMLTLASSGCCQLLCYLLCVQCSPLSILFPAY